MTFTNLQEAYHYKQTGYGYLPLTMLEDRDNMKRVQAQRQGITLLIVPFWWDKTPERFAHRTISLMFTSSSHWKEMFSLIATIKAARPDLLSELTVDKPPIPLQMPPNLIKPSELVEGIGEPINASFLTKATVNPTGW
jgi:hypothetical protein